MQLIDIYGSDDLVITEANLRNKVGALATAGALAAGVFGSHHDDSDKTPKTHAVSYKADKNDKDYKDTDKEELPVPSVSIPELPPLPKKKSTHPNYPDELEYQHGISANDKIAKFINVFVPLIDKANAEIEVRKQFLDHITQPGYMRTEDDIAWGRKMMEEYGADDLKDLKNRMDVVPCSLALAQAVLESGWGTSSLARSSNAFFGQRAWTSQNSTHAGGNDRYSAFDTPLDSVRAYIHNLNTHPAYADFRKKRALLRKENKPITGSELASTLHRYSERGINYTNELLGFIRSPVLKHIDARNN